MHFKNVDLVPISEYEFQIYKENSIKNYAKEKVKSGNWSENESENLSRKSFENILKDGINTKGHTIFSIRDRDNGSSVGILWVEWNNKEFNSTYIWDILIFENYRKLRYGSSALRELEIIAKMKGSKAIVLHVFGHNHIALDMYNKLGFKVTNIIMKKEI